MPLASVFASCLRILAGVVGGGGFPTAQPPSFCWGRARPWDAPLPQGRSQGWRCSEPRLLKTHRALHLYGTLCPPPGADASCQAGKGSSHRSPRPRLSNGPRLTPLASVATPPLPPHPIPSLLHPPAPDPMRAALLFPPARPAPPTSQQVLGTGGPCPVGSPRPWHSPGLRPGTASADKRVPGPPEAGIPEGGPIPMLA